MIDEIDIRQQEINRLQEENRRLRAELEAAKSIAKDYFIDNYTGNEYDDVNLRFEEVWPEWIKEALGGR